MSPTGDQRMTRADAERLLATGEGPAALSALLAAAASPPTAAELQGTQQALAAFRSAHLAPAPAPRSARMWRSALTKVAAVKVAGAAALATAATGGIALAAASGALPFQAHPGTPAVAVHPSSAAATHPNGHATDEASEAESSEAARPSKVPAGTPSPSLNGLCHAFQAGAMSHGNVANNPAFTVLITAAGGADGVAAYCTTLIGPAPTHGRPTDLPAPHRSAPGGPPAVVPTHPVRPVSPPAGRPTSVPPPHPTAPSQP
jgi:hypothetical protein